MTKLLAACCLTALLLACSHSEDNTPSMADQNVFAPAADDLSSTAQLRREFFGATGSYLLFTDTLLTVSNGRAADGTLVAKTELLDVLGYALPGEGDAYYDYVYTYITGDEARRQAAEAVRRYLVPRLGRALPYAFMIVDKIEYEDYYDRIQTVTKLLGLRAYVVSMAEGAALDDPEGYFRQMIADMVKDKVTRMSEDELERFYVFSRDYYMQYKEDLGLSATRMDDKEIWRYGFFTDVYGFMFPYQNSDLEDWLANVLKYSREQFEAMYGSVPLMMEKYDALRSIIEDDLGYILD